MAKEERRCPYLANEFWRRTPIWREKIFIKGEHRLGRFLTKGDDNSQTVQ